MDTRRFQRIQEIFSAVVEAAPGDREALLRERCGPDADLQREVEAMLAADARADAALDAGPEDLLALIEDGGPTGDAVRGMDPPARETVGPYRILEELGRGGMGVVYRAVREEGTYTREVALKLMAESLAGTRHREEAERRFRRECQILAGLEHPGIGRLYEAGLAEDGRPWMAMERVRGEPIHRYCDARRLDVADRLKLFEQVAAAVDYAHRQLVIHRDLKPSNILVTDDGEVKLLDFGIAKVLADPAANPGDPEAAVDPQTRVGQRVLTPEYASPEQMRGEPLSTASDIYSLGVLLHRLLTGGRPAVDRLTGTRSRAPSAAVTGGGKGGNDPLTADEVDPAEAARLRSTTPARLARTLSGELDALLLTALREEPDRRYPSAAALLDDLVRWREGRPLEARAPTTSYRLRKFLGRHRVPVAAAALVLLSLVVGFGTAVQQARIARAERDAARAVSGFLEGLFEASNRLAPGARRDTLPVSAFLDEAAGSLESTLAGEPALLGRMRRVLGTVYENLGAYERAEPLLETVVAQEDTPADERRVALLSLARMEMGRSDYAAAEARYRGARVVTAGIHGPGSPEVADVELELAGALLNLDRLDEAEALIDGALAVRGGTLGDDALAVSGSLNMLGSLQYRQGRLEEALANMERAVELVRSEVAPDHPQAAIMGQNLGLILLRSDRAEEAEPVLRRSVEALRRVMGPEFPYLGPAIKTWGHALNALDRWDEAEPRFQEALDHARRYASGSPDEVQALLDYGRVLTERGRWEDGRPLLEEAWTLAGRLEVGPAASAAATALAQGHRATGDEAAAARWEGRVTGPGSDGP